MAATPAAAHDQPDADLSFPSTRLAREATRLIEDAQEAYLRNHSLRSFLFAREAAARAGRRPGRDYDEEVVFLICALHDMGLTGHANSTSASRWTARTSPPVPRKSGRHRPPGRHRVGRDRHANHARLPRLTGLPAPPTARDRHRPDRDRHRPHGHRQPGAARVRRRHPRLGGARAVTDAIEAQALANPRKAPAATLPGEILHQRHPELPYLTWDMLLDANAWGD
ncbi:HD domain-containing protein [Micromonospora echinofusca]|uniref:hypothetical protein n=1 Tax=Micromonospora echinofusca TaxID=47858 RepID=UPI00371A1C49